MRGVWEFAGPCSCVLRIATQAPVYVTKEGCCGWIGKCPAVQVSPDVMEEHASAVDAAVAALRYGSVNINVASMLGFCVPRLTWGAFPGNPITARPRPGRMMWSASLLT